MKLLIVLMLLIVVQFCKAQCSELEILNLKKIAIVLGERDYRYAGALKNPLNDALDMSDSLRKVGFEVHTYQDSDLKTMTEAINGWCEKISKYDVALFYYSGHGAEVNGENFLFPIGKH